MIELPIKKAIVVTGQGTDDILLTLDTESPYPNMGYDCLMKISTQKGYGVEYCEKVFGIKPKKKLTHNNENIRYR
jgi:hypothetical protein